MKSIGILGGLGPQATMDFEQRLHRVSQQLLPQTANGSYPTTIVYYFRYPPLLRTSDGGSQPDPRLLAAAKHLGALADFLVIPSNAPHLFQDLIEQAAGCPLVSMIEVTLGEVKRKHWKKVGVLGMGEPKVYLSPLHQLGLTCETIAGSLRRSLDQAILALMRGEAGEPEQAIAREAVRTLWARNVDGILLGCTEIPLLLRAEETGGDLINPAQLLAEAAVRYALE